MRILFLVPSLPEFGNKVYCHFVRNQKQIEQIPRNKFTCEDFRCFSCYSLRSLTLIRYPNSVSDHMKVRNTGRKLRGSAGGFNHSRNSNLQLNSLSLMNLMNSVKKEGAIECDCIVHFLGGGGKSEEEKRENPAA